MKKVLSLVLAVVMVLGLTTIAFAAEKDDRGDHNNYSFGKEVNASGLVADDEFYTWVGSKNPEDKIEIFIGYSVTADAKDPKDAVQKGSKHKLTVNLTKKTGSAAIDSASIKFKDNNAYIEMKLSKYAVATKEIPFKAELTLSYDGKRIKDSTITVEGEYVNPKEDVDKDTDIFYAEDYNIINATETNTKLEIVMNDDISIIAKVFTGKKYYVHIDEEPDDAAIAIMNKYTSIVNYAKFDTTGLGGSTMKFNYSDNMYAYTVDGDGNLVYVGRTNAKDLPYWNRYYISTKELSLPSATEPDAGEPVPAPVEPDNTDNASGGGDDVAPTPSTNYNPGTGR